MSIKTQHNQSEGANSFRETGSALVISLIVLTILAVLGFAALDIADLNLFIAANDRDSKEAFFHADSGVNIGREWVKKAFDDGNSTFFESDAKIWYTEAFNASTYTQLPKYNTHEMQITHVKAGLLDIKTEGTAVIIGAGYEGFGKGLAHGAQFLYLIRSHHEGKRNSRAEVDLGWRDIDN